VGVRELKAARLTIATLLASPHALDYDLTIPGPAIAFVVASSRSNGFRDFDISVLALAWIAPFGDARDCRRDRHAAGPDRNHGALRVGDAARDARPRAVGDRLTWNRASVIRRVASCWHNQRQNISHDCSAGENFDFFHFFSFLGPCGSSASASLFNRVAARQGDLDRLARFLSSAREASPRSKEPDVQTLFDAALRQ
jgi:hypothetical protein